MGCLCVGRVCAQLKIDLPDLGGRKADLPSTTENLESNQFQFKSAAIWFKLKPTESNNGDLVTIIIIKLLLSLVTQSSYETLLVPIKK